MDDEGCAVRPDDPVFHVVDPRHGGRGVGRLSYSRRFLRASSADDRPASARSTTSRCATEGALTSSEPGSFPVPGRASRYCHVANTFLLRPGLHSLSRRCGHQQAGPASFEPVTVYLGRPPLLFRSRSAREHYRAHQGVRRFCFGLQRHHHQEDLEVYKPSAALRRGSGSQEPAPVVCLAIADVALTPGVRSLGPDPPSGVQAARATLPAATSRRPDHGSTSRQFGLESFQFGAGVAHHLLQVAVACMAGLIPVPGSRGPADAADT